MSNEPHETGINARHLTVGVLSITAVLLLVGVLVVQTITAPQAQAFAMNAHAGDYLVSTGQYSESTEYLYVIDGAAERMLAYRFDYNTNKLVPVDGFNLRRLHTEPGGTGKP